MSTADPLVAGRADRISPLITRVLAPNPGVMTGQGTNTYLVGDGELVVIDPGPEDVAHTAAVLRAAAGRPIRQILVTHTHPDHWPGTPALAAETGAEVLSFEPRDGLEIDGTLADGDTVAVGGLTLRALHTPGHASNHLCFLLEQERLLFTGDHVMHGSTVVIWPPEGDVRTYLLALRRLIELDPPVRRLLPGHGEPFDDPAGAMQAIIDHRMAREAIVLSGLRRLGGRGTIDELLPVVYADVEARRLPIARGSLWAHLRKLADEGTVTTDAYDSIDHGHWTLTT